MIKIPVSRPHWRRRAIHEAAHAVVAATLNALDSVTLREALEDDRYILGRVWHHAWAADERLLITASGAAGERLMLGTCELDDGDRERFTETCREAGLDVAVMRDLFRRWADDEVREHRAWIERTAASLMRVGYLDAGAVFALRPHYQQPVRETSYAQR